MFNQLFQISNQLLLKWYGRSVESNLIYFESFHGKQYSDNPRAIYEYIRHFYPKYHCVWGVKKGYESIFDKYNIPYVYRFTPQWYRTVAKARVWVTNTRTKSWISKSPHTVYINTWHGTPLKQLGLDIQQVNIGDESTEQYHRDVEKETGMWDYLVSPSHYTDEIFTSAFNVTDNQLLKVGYPRNDKLVNEKHNERLKNAIRHRLGIPKDKKIILYAPTWRDNQTKGDNQYHFEMPFDPEKIISRYDDCVLLVRMHYLVSEQMNFTSHQICDVSHYEEMSDLLLISDLLITDYSSSLFDYAILGRPMIFYMYDRETYQNALRGTYFNFEQTLPGPIVEHESDLQNCIDDWHQSKNIMNQEQYYRFSKEFNAYEKGDASMKIAKYIDDLIQHPEDNVLK